MPNTGQPKGQTKMRIDFGDTGILEFVNSETVDMASKMLAKDGFVVMDNIISGKFAHGLNQEFAKNYGKYFEDKPFPEAPKVGNRRYMVPLAFTEPFGNPNCFANPRILAIVRELLGKDAILDSYGAVVSLTGSKAQHVHRDAPPIFGPALSPILPTYALTFAMPLIEMNDRHGTTALWPGSHRWKDFDKDKDSVMPVVPPGSGILWDYRLFHGGTPNVSDQHRPLVYATYARPWYRDPANFISKGQARLLLKKEFVRILPDSPRRLFAHLSGIGSA